MEQPEIEQRRVALSDEYLCLENIFCPRSFEICHEFGELAEQEEHPRRIGRWQEAPDEKGAKRRASQSSSSEVTVSETRADQGRYRASPSARGHAGKRCAHPGPAASEPHRAAQGERP